MSTFTGKLVGCSLILGPPLAITLISLNNPRFLIDTSKTALVIISFLYYWIVKQVLLVLRSPLLSIPSVPGTAWILGDVVAAEKKPTGSSQKEWIDTIENSGLVRFFGFFCMSPTLLVTTTDGLHDVLLKTPYDFCKPDMQRTFLERITGRGLIAVEDNEHKLQRKIVTPAFSGRHIRDLTKIFWSKSQDVANAIAGELVKDQDEKFRTGIVEVNQWASRATLDIIGLACVGRDFDAIYNSDNEFVKQYDKVLKAEQGNPILISFLTYLIPDYVLRWVPIFEPIRQASEGRYQLRPLSRKLIETKRRDMETESEKHVDILSVLISSGQLSDDELVDQVRTFLVAGHETTSAAFTWICWLLATNATVQSRLRGELLDHFPIRQNSEIDASSFEGLLYLNAVIDEQLRLIPPVPMTIREAVHDTVITGQHVPKGTRVLICPWAINRSQKIWGTDAEEFKPERWLNGQSPHPAGLLSVLTFLHGPRSCIGQTFSRAELKCLVVSMVTRFELQMADPDEVIEPAGLITIKPKHGLRLRLREL
ncbi:cytochrome p450 3a16 [Acrodontium crateriforme]|uniref:Cytochrome p450 3a16 n=1 Tax=Acrodontium crateriforme TaxID=150365 RepID=A0AAQ3R660_9PEZI|nr:cytochrome p450 3a16 [Acrodontium crateriforme]